MKYLIFDFDGVLIDSLGAYAHFYADNRNISTNEARQFLIEHTMHNHKSSFIKNFVKNYYVGKLADYMNEEDSHLQTKLLDDINALKNSKSIVSRNNSDLIQDSLKAGNYVDGFQFIYGYNNSKSKVWAVRQIVSKKSIGIQDIIFITDTAGDIEELLTDQFLLPEQVIGVSWGFHSKKVLEKYLPKLQICNATSDLIKKLKNYEKN
jgi:phosphoglycolate phosphatase-like HAD superfamily hydrolase